MMRFVLFNLVVAAALVYLLSDGSMSGRLQQTADVVRDRISGLGGRHKSPARQQPDTRAASSSVAPVTAPAPITDRPVAGQQPANRSPDVPDAVPELPADEPIVAAMPVSKPPAPDAPEPARAPPVPPATPAATPASAQGLLPTDDPAVRRRRAEVLDTAAPAAATTDKGFMSPQSRRRELQALSEEMELLFSELIAR